jgi:hypothetical protein
VDAEKSSLAFERGDFAEARRLALALKASATDEATRSAADQILQRTSLDPLILAVSIACLLLFTLIATLAR